MITFEELLRVPKLPMECRIGEKISVVAFDQHSVGKDGRTTTNDGGV